MRKLSNISMLTVTSIVLLLLPGCAAQLAPDYDQALVDGLVSINTEVMQYFASVSSGTTKDTFSEREDSYNKLIGSLDALEIQAKARPFPKNDATEKINEFLSERGVNMLESDEAPSAYALKKISETITKMRDTDKKQGITAVEVLAFKGQTVIYLDQALTYESFLER